MVDRSPDSVETTRAPHLSRRCVTKSLAAWKSRIVFGCPLNLFAEWCTNSSSESLQNWKKECATVKEIFRRRRFAPWHCEQVFSAAVRTVASQHRGHIPKPTKPSLQARLHIFVPQQPKGHDTTSINRRRNEKQSRMRFGSAETVTRK